MHARPLICLALVMTLIAGCSRPERHLERGREFLAEGDYDKAAIEYLNVLAQESLNPEAISQLGIIYFDQGRGARSIMFLRKAVELQPANSAVRVRLGMHYLAVGNFSAARNEAQLALAANPADEEAPILLAETAQSPQEGEQIKARLAQLPAAVAAKAPVLVARATLELKARKLAEAEALLDQAVKADPQSGAAHAALGVIHRLKNEPAKAVEQFKLCSSLLPPRSPRRLLYPRILIDTGDLAGAKKDLESLTKQAPDLLPAWVMRAQIAGMEKEYDNCGNFLGKVLSREPEHPEALLLIARMQIAKGAPAKAVESLQKLVQSYPRFGQAHYQLALALLATREEAKAIDSLTKAVSLAPDLNEAVMTLAELNLRSGNPTASVGALKPLLERNPNLPAARIILADAYRRQGFFDLAMEQFDLLEKSTKRTPQIAVLRGVVRIQQGDRDAARRELEQALEMQPGFMPAIEQLVIADLQARDTQSALARIEKEIARDPAAPDPYLLKARVLDYNRDASGAEAALHRVIELRPDSPFAYSMLTRLLIGTKQLDRALENAQKLLKSSPNNSEALMIIGVINEGQGKLEAARDAYEKLLETNPNFGSALNNLAYLYAEKLNNHARARELALRARERLPNDPHVSDTLGWVLYRNEEYVRALGLLKESAASLPESYTVHYHLGAAAYKMGEETVAIDALRRAKESDAASADKAEIAAMEEILGLKPAGLQGGQREAWITKLEARKDDPVALLRLAGLRELAGDTAAAIAAAEKAAKANDTNPQPQLALARLHIGRKDTAKALDYARNARKLAPTDPSVARVLAHLAYQLNDFAWAASLYEESARKIENDPNFDFERAEALLAIGRVADAEAILRGLAEARPAPLRAGEAREILDLVAQFSTPDTAQADRVQAYLKGHPGSLPAAMALAAIQSRGGDASTARKSLGEILERYPLFNPARRELVLLAARGNGADDKAALEYANKAREAFPADLELAKAFGVICVRTGDVSRAQVLLRECVTKKADDAESWYYLGLAQQKAGQSPAAKESLQKAVSLNLKPDLATDARRRLTEIK